MTAPLPSVSPAAAPANPAVFTPAELSVEQIERSCRIPVVLLVSSAVAWLGLGALLGFVAAIKAHAPGFLADASWLTYGRVYPASQAALAYGFILQAGLGIGLWLFCRLGRGWLQGLLTITASAILWNVGVLIGVGSILTGRGTGFPWIEMPAAAAPALFAAYVLIAAWALVSLHTRWREPLYVSQWFLLMGLLWFPWVYSTAELLLIYFPVRGVMQAVVNGWYIQNLFEICMPSFGLACIFYFLPKLLGKSLHSRGLALFGFWLLALFGGWGGLACGEPVPNWVSSVSVVARVFLLLPVLAFALSWSGTLAGTSKAARSQELLRFVWIAMVSYVLAAVIDAIGAAPAVNRVTAFTLFHQGTAQLRIHGFLAPALAAAIYYTLPRLLSANWPSPGLIRLHLWSVVAGLALSVVALLAGGVIQGVATNEPQLDFVAVVRRVVPFLGTNTLGMTLLLIGYLAFVVNVGRLLVASCPYTPLWGRLRPPQASATALRRSVP